MLSFAALATALLSAAGVNAHGYVQSLKVDGQDFSGYLPWADPYEPSEPQRIVRKIPGDGPIEDVNSPDLACNVGGNDGANTVADISAGKQISFTWNTWPSDHAGPITIMMADCNGDCKSFKAENAQWFKIDQAGYENGQWATDKLIQNDATWTSTIPSELKDGQYLIRMEILALHSSPSNPQMYPSCAQLNVKNGGGKTPADSDLNSIPGIYNGFTFPFIWDNFRGSDFKIAGKAVVDFANAPSGGGSNSGSDNSNAGNDGGNQANGGGNAPAPASSSSAASSASSSAAQEPAPTGNTNAKNNTGGSKGSCRKNRRRSTAALSSGALRHRRSSHHLSRLGAHSH